MRTLTVLLIIGWAMPSQAADITRSDLNRMASQVGSALSTRAHSARINAPVVVGAGRAAHLHLGLVGVSATCTKAIAAADGHTLQRKRQLRLGLTVGPQLGFVAGRATSWYKPDKPGGSKIDGIAMALGTFGGVSEYRADNPNNNTCAGLEFLNAQNTVVGQPAKLPRVGLTSRGSTFGLALGKFNGWVKTISKNVGKSSRLTDQQRTAAAATPVTALEAKRGAGQASQWKLLLEVEARGDYLRQELMAIRYQANQPDANLPALMGRLTRLLPEAQAVERISNRVVEGFFGLR